MSARALPGEAAERIQPFRAAGRNTEHIHSRKAGRHILPHTSPHTCFTDLYMV